MPPESSQPPVDTSVPVPPPIAPQIPVPPQGTPSIHQLKQSKLMLVGVGALAVILLITTLLFASQASTTDAKLKDQYASGDAAGRAAQKKADTIKFNKELTSSFRTYEAPVKDGSFQVSYPKGWNLTINSDSSTPVTGLVNPDYVDLTATKYALSFILKDTSYDTLKKTYDDMVKNGKSKTKLTADKLTVEAVTVSGIKGYKYTGVIWRDNKNTGTGTVIVLPLRDKTMLLQTDNNELYLDSFNRMVQTIKLVP